MTRLEQTLTNIQSERDKGVLTNPGEAMLKMMQAINDDIRFLFNECHNLHVGLAKTLKELQRVKNAKNPTDASAATPASE